MCKKLIFLTSFVLVTAVVSDASADMVGYWKLDEGAGTTVADSSGAGHNGFFGEGTPGWVEGVFGKALKFNGNNKVDIPDHPDFHLEDAVSIALWVKPTEAVQPGYGKFFCKQKIDEYPYAIQYNGSGESIRATVYASARVDSSSIPNFVGQWGHLCMTYDGSAVILYKDGEEVGRAAASGKLQQNDLSLSIGGRLESSHNFIGITDDVRLYSHALTVEEIQQVMEGPPAGPAYKPSPDDGQTDVPRDVVLSWTPGEFASPINGQKVYFSENFSDVNDGIGGIAQSETSYTPPQRLDFGTTYYWRVDEVNNVNPESPWIGNVWSFTTEPVAYPIENITATASSVHQGDMGPENTINGSGLDDNDLHTNEPLDMWLSGNEPLGGWIEYQFDKVYKLHQIWVWNSNQAVESLVGFGVKDVTIEYSTNGTDWTTLAGVPEFAQAPGAAGYAHNTTVDFGGAAAKYVRITAQSNWGFLAQYGLSEVRFFYIPALAREPSPDSGAAGVPPDVVLSWRAGREAAQHDVYVSTDEQAVINGTAPVISVTEASHGPLSLDLGQTYYWKINEVNEVETPTTWEGELWNFTTREFLVVDDFESYNDLDPTDPESNRIFNVWIDGFQVPANGSLVGYDAAPFAEQIIVHSDEQSMPFFYANTDGAASSEAELTLTPSQDWTKAGVATLVLYFHGAAGNTGQLYVKINSSKVVYDGDAADIATLRWKQWNIDLASLGLNLQNVTKLA
ncbi:MAG: LamG-like jellyroll fold domain-containing protein, partial [Planctomycetota bacterium]